MLAAIIFVIVANPVGRFMGGIGQNLPFGPGGPGRSPSFQGGPLGSSSGFNQEEMGKMMQSGGPGEQIPSER